MELCSLGGGMTRAEVARHEASALADEHPHEAEAAFLRAGAPEHAVRMWLTHNDYQRALALAEQHAAHMVRTSLSQLGYGSGDVKVARNGRVGGRSSTPCSYIDDSCTTTTIARSHR